MARRILSEKTSAVNTLSTAWDFYARLTLSNRKAQVIDAGRYRNYLEPCLGKIPLTEIKNLQIALLRQNLEGQGLSLQTVHHCLSLLRRVLRRAIEWELYPGPVPVFRMPKFDNKRMRYLSKEEAISLLANLKLSSKAWHDITVLALNTGLRAGEIFKITLNDINFIDLSVHIKDTKSNKNRIVPLNKQALKVLLDNSRDGDKEKPIFNINAAYTRPFTKAVEQCGFNDGVVDRRERVVFHTLRHTFASWLVQEGVPIVIVAQLLGHSDLRMTMRYSHLAPNAAKSAVNTYLPELATA